MHLYETTARIVNFLSESSRSFGSINLFDVTRAATGATYKFTDVSSTSIWQFFPMLKFPFVLCARSHCAMRLPHDLRLTQPPLQLSTTTVGCVLYAEAISDLRSVAWCKFCIMMRSRYGLMHEDDDFN